MKLIELKCPHCGAQLSIDGNSRQITCQFCDAPFMIDDAEKAPGTEKAKKINKHHVRTLAECAALIALGTVLSLLKIPIGHLGGSVTLLSTLPLIVICYRHGIGWGFLSTCVYSIFQMLVDIPTVVKIFAPGEGLVWYMAILSIFLDYLFAFTVIGVASFFSRIKNPTAALSLGALAGLTCRYISHFLSGWIFYGAWASWYFDAAEEGSFASISEGTAKFGAWVLSHFGSGQGLAAFYSAFYNGLYMIPEIIITVIGAVGISFIPFIRNKNSRIR